jgi:hypothetical protein
LTSSFLLVVFPGYFSPFSHPLAADFLPWSLILSFCEQACLLLPAGRCLLPPWAMPLLLLGLLLISFLPRKEKESPSSLMVSRGAGSIRLHHIWLSDPSVG